MLINGMDLLDHGPIRNMAQNKERLHGVSHGLAEVGYDIRLKQEIEFCPPIYHIGGNLIRPAYTTVDGRVTTGTNFTLASAMEEFNMPSNLAGVVHDKSTWARKGLSVFNTVIEPGWRGFLTLELVYHGPERLVLPAGCGIAQVLFHQVANPSTYTGKYQDQEDRPVESILA